MEGEEVYAYGPPRASPAKEKGGLGGGKEKKKGGKKERKVRLLSAPIEKKTFGGGEKKEGKGQRTRFTFFLLLRGVPRLDLLAGERVWRN